MRTRCTLITRIRTSDGIVGEAYNGDTDDEQRLIMAIIRDEMVPQLIGRDAAISRAPGRRCCRPATTNCATAVCYAGHGLYRLCALGCLRQAHRPTVISLWGGYRDAVPAIGIGGYYGHSDDELREEVQFFLDHGFCGMKFKIGGMTPEEDAAPPAGGARLRRPVVRPDLRCQSGLHHRAGGGILPAGSRMWGCAGSRSPAAGITTAAACAMCGLITGIPVPPARAS